MTNSPLPLLALFLGGAALFVWSALLARAALFYVRERRALMLLMYLTGWLASAGTFASAIGFSISSGMVNAGVYTVDIQTAVTFGASVGRGALLMAGLYLLIGHLGTPPDRKR